MSAYGFGGMIKKLKENPKTIVFTEGTDARILEAASRLLASNFLTPILIGDEDEIIDAAENEGYNIRGAQISSIPSSMTALTRWSIFSASSERAKA